MPTARSWTSHQLHAARRAVVDVRHLLWFRSASVRRKRAARSALVIFVVVTASIATVPAYLPGAGDLAHSEWAHDLMLLLPSALAGLLLLAIISSVASGGGRELLSREQGVAYPVSPTTDHLGALLMAPLNISWMLQAWILLGATAYSLGHRWLAGAQLIVVLWVVFATAVAQILAWTVEWIRRRDRGPLVVRLLGVGVAIAIVWVKLLGLFGTLLDQLPTRRVLIGMVSAREGLFTQWLLTVLALLAGVLVAVVVGAIPAHLAARRAPRDGMRLETGVRPARRTPASDLLMLIRVDRGSVWRAVPMRRGMMVLGLGPGLIALAGGLEWSMLTVLPGLVASGAALLFGVNAWCLDERGTLWRESLPVRPGTVFTARTIVLTEWLLAGSAMTVLLASLRAGAPTASEITALLCAWVVVTVQVVGGAMRWSNASPFSVDLRSARATPAPPVVMVGYSARLALTTTVTGLIFSGMARQPYWNLTLGLAMPMVVWSLVRFSWTRRDWIDPFRRARVVMTVAA